MQIQLVVTTFNYAWHFSNFYTERRVYLCRIKYWLILTLFLFLLVHRVSTHPKSPLVAPDNQETIWKEYKENRFSLLCGCAAVACSSCTVIDYLMPDNTATMPNTRQKLQTVKKSDTRDCKEVRHCRQQRRQTLETAKM